MKNEYDLQAENFAKKNNVKFDIIGKPKYKKHFTGDKEQRYVFTCRLRRNGKQYTFLFGQSIAAGAKEPRLYDVLACLQKYDVGSFEDFCGEFGYNDDSRTAERIYKAVCKEYDGVNRLFSDCIEELQEIN
jgi:hypothetical protein